MVESEFSASAYDRVYDAERPEIFFKSLPDKVVSPRESVGIRRDARWNVPEPELALAINSAGAIVGFTIGNDMSSRDIEGENLLYLPQAKAIQSSVKSELRESPTGTEAILLVEDDDDVRTGTTRILAGLGYDVVAAADAATALMLLRGRSDIRLLLTDVVLTNGPSGPELAADVRQLRPDLKVLFMSGHIQDTAGFHEQLQRDAHFLPKPFRKEELARIVRFALDDGAT